MPYFPDDTICAIATARGGAARGMIRLSGPDAVAISGRLFEAGDGSSIAAVRRPTAIAGSVRFESGPQPGRLPCDLYLWPGIKSYTRQPVAELHTYGSPPLLQALLSEACIAGARLAEPGEFTLRAFLAGRIDLTQAEGVLGVIDAQGEEELRTALAQLAGGISRPLQQLREELLQLLAELEAGLDFVEEDIEFVSSRELGERLEAAHRVLCGLAEQWNRRNAPGGLPRVVLVGPPNAGKSSLFNALVARHTPSASSPSHASFTPALVSSHRGTTRDYLTSTLDLDGLQCELVDTAGLEEQPSEEQGPTEEAASGADLASQSPAQTIARNQKELAAVRVHCIDASTTGPQNWYDASCDLIVLTKADVAQPARWQDDESAAPVMVTSSRTGEGLDELAATIRGLLTIDAAGERGQVVTATADRCRESIRLTIMSMATAREVAAAARGDELIAAELRTALSELGKVVGTVYTDDLLDRIFSTFCIGK